MRSINGTIKDTRKANIRRDRFNFNCGDDRFTKRSNNMRRFIDRASFIVIILTFLGLIYYALMSLYPFEIIKFSRTDAEGNGIFKMNTPIVKAGGTIEYICSYTQLIDMNGEISCYFEDEILYQVVGRSNSLAIGKHCEGRAVEIPIGLKPDTYRFGCNIDYTLPTGRVLRYTFYTEPFTVIE